MLHTPRFTRDAPQGRRQALEHWPGTTPSTSSNLHRCVHSQRATSCRTGGSAPPRTDRRSTHPAQLNRAGRAVVGGTGTVPVFTVIRSTKEEPDFVPAASPRLPRSTSPWPPAEPPMDRSGVPRTAEPAWPAGRWSGARRSRPISARFGAGSVLRDFETPVPRVLLSVTLAEPAPSGSTSTPRRCQDCSRPPRHLPEWRPPRWCVTGPVRVSS
jgi:hypothetical protein